MTARHTPGPWRINPGAGEVRGADWNVIVADVASDADARLIAAAPDLFALANAVIAAHHAGRDVPPHLLRMAHIAQALATGEASRDR